MSLARALDDLARVLAEPMSRRRALRLAGASLVAVAVPGVAPSAAHGGSARSRRSNTCAPEWQVCAYNEHLCCPPDRPVCCSMVSPSSGQHGCCKSEAHCCGGNTCCDPATEECDVSQGFGVCVKHCPDRRPRCGSTCCRAGETCRSGKCCPSSRLCGDKCCPSGKQCAFSGRSRVCCPSERLVPRKIAGRNTRFCCPTGTRVVFGSWNGQPMYGCCPPNDYTCCVEDELVPLVPPSGDELAPLNPFHGRVFCVRGRARRL